MFLRDQLSFLLLTSAMLIVGINGCAKHDSPTPEKMLSHDDTSFKRLIGKHPTIKKGPADIFADTTGKSR